MAGVILLVDDEPSVLESFQLLVEREGHATVTAASLGEAFALLQEPDLAVDAILCDILLQDRSGLDLLDFLNQRGLDVPVILVTGEPNHESAAEAVRRGAFDYLAKPLRREALALALRRAREHKRLLDRKRRLEQENEEYRNNLEALIRARTLALIRVNEELLQENEERRRAEEALAALNKSLEAQVAARTRQLAEQNRVLEEGNRRLMELDSMKSAFLSLVSHELRTPMTSVLGFAKLIQKDFQRNFQEHCEHTPVMRLKGKRIVENLQIIQQEGRRLTRIIEDVLDITRIEAGRMDWREEPVAPAALLHRAAQAMQGVFQEKPAVSLVVDCHSDLPPILVDPDRLLQVLINLVSNAQKFTIAGEVRLQARLDNGGVPPRLRFTVQDTGPGIHPDDAAHIFDKFFQGRHVLEGLQIHGGRQNPGSHDSQSGLAKPHGAGLGLVICRTIVEHYHGRIWVESTLGAGSAFHVELPLPPAA